MPRTQTSQAREQPDPQRLTVGRSDGSVNPADGPFKNVLCAVDGTEGSTAAVRMAASLTGRDGHLTLLAATAEVDGTAAISPAHARRVLEDAARIAERAGVPHSTVLDPDGPPVDVILERARAHELVVIGPPAFSRVAGMIIGHISSSVGGQMIGGVTAAALNRLPTPLLVVRPPLAGSSPGERMLVASDGEQGSDRLVKLAGRIGQSRDAQVTLVNALGAESKMNPRTIQAQADTLKRLFPDAGEPCIEPGKAWEVILEAARRKQATMVVIGSRRRGGVKAFGSVSRRVVHDAPCSVLVVPPSNATAR